MFQSSLSESANSSGKKHHTLKKHQTKISYYFFNFLNPCSNLPFPNLLIRRNKTHHTLKKHQTKISYYFFNFLNPCSNLLIPNSLILSKKTHHTLKNTKPKFLSISPISQISVPLFPSSISEFMAKKTPHTI